MKNQTIAKRGLPKIRNVIWLDPQDYIDIKKVYEPFEDYMASNEFITKVIRIFLHDQQIVDLVMPQIFKEMKDNGVKIKEIEKVVIEKKVSVECPFCREDFTSKGQKYLRKHILSVHVKTEGSAEKGE